VVLLAVEVRVGVGVGRVLVHPSIPPHLSSNSPPPFLGHLHHHQQPTDRESDDVDVALDNVSGQAFAEALNEHLRAQGLETRSVGVIQVIFGGRKKRW
jgi:hypothetical protein